MYDDKVEGLVTAGNNDRQRKAVQTVGPRVGLHQNKAMEHCCLHRQLVQLEIVNRPLLIPLKNLRLRSLQPPCTIAVNEIKTINI